MKKALTFALAFSCLALCRSSFAQDSVTRTVGAVAAESGNREQDRLIGPVRRVKVETARIVPRNGNWVELPREDLGITTYDPTGIKIDSVVHPVERTALSGREQYLYDQKGNVVEMILLSPDGSMLSKESYKYEFDELGNWTKMSSSVAVYENGKIVFEPTGITYRTISYYYNQAIEKLNGSSAKPRGGVSTPVTSSTLPGSNGTATDSARVSTPVAQVSAPSQPPVETASVHANTEPVTAPASVSPAKNGTGAPASPGATTSAASPAPETTQPASPVQVVAEEELRSAAIELPNPEYSAAALQAQAGGKVRVQILVDETGHVTTAQATSGHPLLAASAEAAARKARFSMAKVSSGATRVYGVISFDFVPPQPANAALPAPSMAAVRNVPKPEDAKPKALPTTDRDAGELKPMAPVNYSEAAKSSYDKGVAFQATGRYAEAAEAFNQTIKADPNDAKAYARLGMVYSAMAKHKDAIIVYKMARQINESVLGAPAFYMWGHSYLALDKNSDALSALKQALNIITAQTIDLKQPQRYPSLEALHYSMGIAYLNSKRFGNSIDEIKKAVKLNPKNAEAHYALAIAYVSDGNRREAVDHLRTLGSLDPALAQKLSAALAVGTPPGCLNIACRR